MVSYTNKNDSIENAIRFLLINLDRKFVHKWQFVNWRITWRIDRIFGGEWHFDNTLLRRNNCVLHKIACAILLQKYYGKVCPIMDGIGHFLQIGNGVTATCFVVFIETSGPARTWNRPAHCDRLGPQLDRPQLECRAVLWITWLPTAAYWPLWTIGSVGPGLRRPKWPMPRLPTGPRCWPPANRKFLKNFARCAKAPQSLSLADPKHPRSLEK